MLAAYRVPFLANIVTLIVIERVQVGLGNLHADQNFVIGVVLTLHIFHLKEVVEDSSQGLHLVDRLQFGHVFVLLALFMVVRAQHCSNIGTAAIASTRALILRAIE